MKRWLPFFGIALGASLVVYALFFAKTEQEQIRSRLQELSASVRRKDARESDAVRSARLRKDFGELFAKDVTLAVPELGSATQGRSALIEFAASAPQEFAELDLSLDALRVQLDESKEHAIAIGQAQLSATRREGTREKETRTVSLRLDKRNGEWRIVDVSVAGPNGDHAEKSKVAPRKEDP